MTYRQIVDFRKELLSLPQIYQSDTVEEILASLPSYATSYNNYQQVSINTQLSSRKYWLSKFDNETPTIPLGIYADYIQLSDENFSIPKGFILNTPTIFSKSFELSNKNSSNNSRNDSNWTNITLDTTNWFYYMSAAIYVQDINYSPFLYYNSSSPLFSITTNRATYTISNSSAVVQINDAEIQSYTCNIPSKGFIGGYDLTNTSVYCNPIIFYSKYKLPPTTLPRIYYTDSNIITPIDCWLTIDSDKSGFDYAYYPKPNE